MFSINDACTHDKVNATQKSRLNQTTRRISQKMKPLENKLTKHVNTKRNSLQRPREANLTLS